MSSLKEIRARRGMSQLALAKLTNIQPGDISKLENGWLRPYPKWRKRLAKVLGVSQSEIFPDDETLKGGEAS